MVGKESLKGRTFYKQSGMKQVVIYIPMKYYRRLKIVAKKDDRSIQKTVMRLLIPVLEKKERRQRRGKE